jgi:hypothetical protein
MPIPSQNFEGVNNTGSIPPDTNGDVGPNYYVQWVNTQFKVFNKSGGTVFGPTPRDYSYDMPKKARAAALRSALSQRALKITPFFQASIPSRAYPTLGHAAAERDHRGPPSTFSRAPVV